MAEEAIGHMEDGDGGIAANGVGASGIDAATAGPVARDLNRNLTALLGPCPATVYGRWVHLRESFPGAWNVTFPELGLDQALRLSTALATIDEKVGLGTVARELPSVAHYDLSRVLSTAPAAPASTVHVEVPR